MKSSLLALGFDKIYCINLKRREDRLNHAFEQFAKVGLMDEVEIWEARDGVALGYHDTFGRFTPGMIACFETHKDIWKDALEKGYNQVLIFEDDLEFKDNFELFMQVALPSIPEDWQFVWLGFNEREKLVKAMVSDWWCKTNDTWGMQAYMIKGKETFEILLRENARMFQQIDEQISRKVIYPELVKGYGIFPPAVKQADLKTDVQLPKKRVIEREEENDLELESNS